jgi:hypothetical protein
MWYSAVGSIVILFLSLLAAPLVAGAQPAGKVPTIGFVTHNTAAQNTQAFEIFAQGLRELGYIDGQTITIERRYVEGQFERVPALVAELATRHIDVFVVTSSPWIKPGVSHPWGEHQMLCLLRRHLLTSPWLKPGASRRTW